MDRHFWKLVWVAGAVPVALIGLAVVRWQERLAYVPPVPKPTSVLPVPNGRDDFVVAVEMLPDAGARRVDRLHTRQFEEHQEELGISTPRLREIIREAQPALARLRAGLGHDFGTPAVLSRSESTWPLEGFDMLAQTLEAEAELNLRDGHPVQALERGLEAMKMGTLIPRKVPFLHAQGGVLVASWGFQAIERAVDRVDAATAEQGARRLLALDAALPPYSEALERERAMGMYMLSQILRASSPARKHAELTTRPGYPPRPLSRIASLRLLVTPRKQVLAEYGQIMDQEIKRARLPFVERRKAWRNSRLLGAYFMRIPARSGGYEWDNFHAIARILATRLAIRAYTLREGDPPASLAALTPKYLPVVPEDPYGPGPLLYRTVGGERVVYSRSFDGDDDGAVDHRIASSDTEENGDLLGTFLPRLRVSARRAE